MRNTELNFFENNNFEVYENYPFYDVFRTIEELRKIRTDNKQITRGVNYSIIIQLSTFIEGMTSQILWSAIEPKFYEIERVSELDKDFFFRILENLESEVINSYFKDFEKNWYLVHKVNLKNVIKENDPNLWESIEMIFKLRNAISHGNKLTVEYHPTENGNEPKIVVLHKYKIIYDFLTKKNL